MDVEVALSSPKSLQRATVKSTSSAEDVPPKCLCRYQQRYTTPKVRRALCVEEPVYSVASGPVLLTAVRASTSPCDLRPPQPYFSARNRRADLFFG